MVWSGGILASELAEGSFWGILKVGPPQGGGGPGAAREGSGIGGRRGPGGTHGASGRSRVRLAAERP